jgi:hypothetical protein
MSVSALSTMIPVQVPGREKSVLLYLADQATPEGVVVMPSNAPICRVTCWSSEQVDEAIASLKASGHLRALTPVEARAVPREFVADALMLEPSPA